MDDKRSYLNEVSFFRDLPNDDIKKIHEKTRLVNYHIGQFFFIPGDNSDLLYILKVGRVQLYRMSPDGRKLILAILRPGAIFGQKALLSAQTHKTYAEAVDDCVVCTWNREEVISLLTKNPEMALRLLSSMEERLQDAEQRLTDITFKHLPARIAGLLVRLSIANEPTSDLNGYTHQQLADMLGTYRETVTQILNEFKDQGIIVLGRKRITICDYDALQLIAQDAN